MTEVQEQVLEECRRKLSEHFEGYILAVVYDYMEKNDTLEEGKVVYWGGGWMQAVGMAEYTKHMLLEQTVRKKIRNYVFDKPSQ